MAISSLLAGLLGQRPASLEVPGSAYDAFRVLHEAYREELARVTALMAPLRARMIASGFSADLSDRESELLYLAVREQRPETVVEISPCHGYSTNYLLAALNANRSGHLHSYEISDTVGGRPIEDAIRGNLAEPDWGARLTLHIGDARSQEIPPADLLFIDSAHEDHFAAWLFATQVPRATLVIQHDIVTWDGSRYAPKAWYLGPGESALTLEVLSRNGQRFFSAATGRRALAGHDDHLTPRFPSAERAILYAGAGLSPAADGLCRLVLLIHERRLQALEGLRDQALNKLPEMDFMGRCLYAALLAEMGYGRGHADLLPRDWSRPIPKSELSVGEYVAWWHYVRRANEIPAILRVALGGGPRCVSAQFRGLVRREALRLIF